MSLRSYICELCEHEFSCEEDSTDFCPHCGQSDITALDEEPELDHIGESWKAYLIHNNRYHKFGELNGLI